jgi:hypothetical protein
LRYRNRVALLAFCLSISAGLFAAQISGTVTNGTTNKPAAGQQVVLVSLARGMDEVAHGTSDGQGHFTIDIPDPGVPHLLRVNYQGVNYFQDAPPGATTGDITIYDSAKQVAGVVEDARVYTLQAERGQLQVSVTYTLQNQSQPPLTKMDNETFEVELPPGAQLVDASAVGPSGMPVATSPVPTGKNNRYALVFPIRPGRAQFHLSYTVPYTGSYEFTITPDSTLSELGVLLPKSMQFTGISRRFAQDTDEAGLAVFFAKNVPAHEPVKFSVSGEGVGPREAQAGVASQSAPPAEAPAPASGRGSNALWYVAAAMVVIVGAGAFWLWRKSAVASVRDSPKAARAAKLEASKARRAAVPPAASEQETMLETLKDELFQLENDRLHGKVSDEEYEKSKAGLDALIRRQLKKSGGQQKG